VSPPAPQRDRSAATAPRIEPEAHVPLRLSVTRGALGLELYEPIDVGPIEITGLALTLPNLKFPLDLSGGVPQFRHRRGELERLELRASLDRLARWLEPRAHSVMPGGARVQVWGLEQGIGVGVVGPAGALAFDLLWAPIGVDARFVLHNARAVGLEGSALGHALRYLDSVVGSHVARHGRSISFVRIASRLCRQVLPAIGARVPATGRVQCGGLRVDGDELSLDVDATALPPALTATAARALELADLVADADEALAAGKLDTARTGYVAALERAPRHPELCRLVAEIDVAVGGRAEAALAILVESMPAMHGGVVACDLLAAVGDLEGARAAVEEAARAEIFAPVAALLLRRLALLHEHPRQRLKILDQAVARAPGLAPVRWARFDSRLAVRDVEGAISDAQHVEAAERGARARHAVCRRAARGLLEAGFVRDAGKLYERALRYLPDDPSATAGLARALVEAGRASRAFALFERAIELGHQRSGPDPGALLDLAKLLATEYRDLPQAVARVAQVPASAEGAVEARALEARWRAGVGDLAGASLAYGRLRDTIALRTPTDSKWSRWLMDAARFERNVHGDVVTAERHLALALQLAPHDTTVQRLYREVAAVVAERARSPVPGVEDGMNVAAPESTDPFEADVPEASAAGGRFDADLDSSAVESDAPRAELDHDVLAEEVERLEASLRADPEAMDVVLRLAEVLELLGRDQELLALLSARLEESSADERPKLIPRARGVLERLGREARREDRASEAEVYEAMLRRLTPEPS
jgi:tetratricopeptide (TPR) repeat protein